MSVVVIGRLYSTTATSIRSTPVPQLGFKELLGSKNQDFLVRMHLQQMDVSGHDHGGMGIQSALKNSIIVRVGAIGHGLLRRNAMS